MAIKPFLGSVAVCLLSALLLWAGDPWKDKPYTQWSSEDVSQVLGKSPWGRTVTMYIFEVEFQAATSEVPQTHPGQEEGKRTGVLPPVGRTTEEQAWPKGMPGRSESSTQQQTSRGATSSHNYSVRWASSQTIREAEVRWRQLDGLLDQETSDRTLSQEPQHYVIAIYGPRDQISYIVSRPQEYSDSAYLLRGRDRQRIPSLGIRPIKVKYVGLAEEVVAGVAFYFPRQLDGQPTIPPGETQVTFHGPRLPGSKDIKAKFDLRRMVRDGKPDL